MNKGEAVERMLRIQEVLDHGMTRSLRQLLKALYAEYGEYLQATKEEWAWWKRNDKKFTSEEEAVINEEAIDVLHFWLAIMNFSNSTGILTDTPACLVDAPELCLSRIGSWERVYREYVKKARINLERWGRNPGEIDHLVGEAYL